MNERCVLDSLAVRTLCSICLSQPDIDMDCFFSPSSTGIVIFSGENKLKIRHEIFSVGKILDRYFVPDSTQKPMKHEAGHPDELKALSLEWCKNDSLYKVFLMKHQTSKVKTAMCECKTASDMQFTIRSIGDLWFRTEEEATIQPYVSSLLFYILADEKISNKD